MDKEIKIILFEIEKSLDEGKATNKLRDICNNYKEDFLY